MPVDFDKLPPEEPVPDDPPSRLVWTIVFFVMVFAGVFLVLFLWPKEEPTRAPWFWVCVFVYPLGIASFVVLRRYSVYEGRRLDAIVWNEARKEYVDEVFEQASQPLAILAASYRFASDAKEDAFAKLLDGSVMLEPRVAPKPDARPVNARWFEKPDADEDGVRFDTDDKRRRHVMAWAFGAVIDEVADAVRSMPPDLKLTAQLVVPGTARTEEIAASWHAQWQKVDGRMLKAEVLPDIADLMYVDTWLDRVEQNSDQEARLLVIVQLNAVLQAMPPDGSAESVVAILFVPEAVRRKFNLASVALMHRPNGTSDCSVDAALARAVQWGKVQTSEIKGVWRGGVDGATANATTAALARTSIGTKPADLDYMVGHAGEAAPWLSMAFAAKAAARDGSTQLVVATSQTKACFAVVSNLGTR